MGYGPITNGKQGVITPWKGSWAQTQQERSCPKCPHGKGFNCHICWPQKRKD